MEGEKRGKSVTYASGASVLDDSHGVGALRENCVELVDKGAVVNQTCAICSLVAFEEHGGISLGQIDVQSTDTGAEL